MSSPDWLVKRFSFHQLDVFSMAMLVQILQRLLPIKNPSAFVLLKEHLIHIIRDWGNMGLGIVTLLLLQRDAPTSVKDLARVDSVMEQYFMKNIIGQLVQGYDCLGCTNLEWISDASLNTKLCSGCRKVRYCGVECQKVA